MYHPFCIGGSLDNIWKQAFVECPDPFIPIDMDRPNLNICSSHAGTSKSDTPVCLVDGIQHSVKLTLLVLHTQNTYVCASMPTCTYLTAATDLQSGTNHLIRVCCSDRNDLTGSCHGQICKTPLQTKITCTHVQDHHQNTILHMYLKSDSCIYRNQSPGCFCSIKPPHQFCVVWESVSTAVGPLHLLVAHELDGSM